jgi:hypothetical protein
MSNNTSTPSKITVIKTAVRGPYEDGGWQVVLFNCYCHSFDEVADQITKALGCTMSNARNLANIAHHTGQVKVCGGSEEHCEKVSDILGSIGLAVKVIH